MDKEVVLEYNYGIAQFYDCISDEYYTVKAKSFAEANKLETYCDFVKWID